MKKPFLLLLSMLFCAIGYSQSINGVIYDITNEPIPNVVVVMQTIDSAFIAATTTDIDGKYSLNDVPVAGILIFQHLAYQTKLLTFSNTDYSVCQNIILSDKTTELGTIDVVAHAPTVTIRQGGGLVYNVSKAKEQKSVSSAYDLLKEIPGMRLSGSAVSLIGASNLTLIIDGKVSSMSNEQVAELLKSMSANDVKNIEVMYRAPAKYGVHGAVVNIVKDKAKKSGSPWAMELAPNFEQEFYSSYGGRLNTSYKGAKLYADFLMSGRNSKYHSASEEDTRFAFQEKNIQMLQRTIGKTDYDTYNIRLAADYSFSADNVISAYYYLKPKKYRQQTSATDYKTIHSAIQDNEDVMLQNANLKWQLHNFEFSADYLKYTDDDKLQYNEFSRDTLTTDYLNNSNQDVSQGKINLNYEKEFSDKWSVSVGANGAIVCSKTKIDYLFNNNGTYLLDNDSRQHNKQDEQQIGIYVESLNTLRDSIEISITLEAEFLNSDYNNNGTRSTLWHEWSLFPSLSVTWPLRRDMMQLSLSTNKRYPSYWVVNPQSKQQNSYSYIIGNPQLKPETRYDANFAYIIQKRYTFSAFCSFRDRYFCQLPYVDGENNKVIYQFTNFDKYIQSGIEAEVPITVGFWDAEFTVTLIDQHYQHNNFHGKSFSRNKLCYALSADNTFHISKEKPDLSMTMYVCYLSKSIQGTADISDKWNFDLGLRWAINKNLILNLNWDNILERSVGWPMVTKFDGQYNSLTKETYNCFNATLVWRKNGFKAKRIKTTSTSRIER